MQCDMSEEEVCLDNAIFFSVESVFVPCYRTAAVPPRQTQKKRSRNESECSGNDFGICQYCNWRIHWYALSLAILYLQNHFCVSFSKTSFRIFEHAIFGIFLSRRLSHITEQFLQNYTLLILTEISGVFKILSKMERFDRFTWFNRGVNRTQSNIYDGAFLRKQLTSFSR